MKNKPKPILPLSGDEIVASNRFVYRSRQSSIIGRHEVHSYNSKFGIFGDGKELLQVAVARAFRKDDRHSGYYLDQTWIDALGVLQFRDLLTNGVFVVHTRSSHPGRSECKIIPYHGQGHPGRTRFEDCCLPTWMVIM